MNENKIIISVEEYKTLLLMSAKAAIIKRMVESDKYVSAGDIKAILDIEETEGSTDGKL